MKLFESNKKRSRTASMQLSINTIVILVMAMAVLGLGLGIIKGIKNKSNTFLDFDVDFAGTASASEKIVNVDETLVLRRNKENQMGISFYNDGRLPECQSEGALIRLDCNGLDVEYIQMGTKVDAGEEGKILAKITPLPEDATITSYPCSFQVVCGDFSDGDTTGASDDDVSAELPIFLELVA